MDEELINGIKAIGELYVKVKEIIIIAENLNRKSILAAINEQRNALDHIMAAVNSQNSEEIKHQLKEATQHLNRAGYDTFELLASELIKEISKSINKYDTSIVSAVFPEFYKENLPRLLIIQKDLATIRTHKKLDPVTYYVTQTFGEYTEVVDELISIKTSVSMFINDLEKAAKKKTWQKIKDDWIYRIASGIIVGIGVFFLTKNIYSDNRITQPEKSISTDSVPNNIIISTDSIPNTKLKPSPLQVQQP